MCTSFLCCRRHLKNFLLISSFFFFWIHSIFSSVINCFLVKVSFSDLLHMTLSSIFLDIRLIRILFSVVQLGILNLVLHLLPPTTQETLVVTYFILPHYCASSHSEPCHQLNRLQAEEHPTNPEPRLVDTLYMLGTLAPIAQIVVNWGL